MQGNRSTAEKVKVGKGDSRVKGNVPRVHCTLERQSSYVSLCNKNVQEKLQHVKEEGIQVEQKM